MMSKAKVRRSFTNEEDRHLRKLVRKFGSKNKWNEISALMKTRDPRQCRDRWNYYLSPKNNADKWTEEEDRLLFDLYEQRGRKWATFKPYFNGRTTVNIKSRWYFLNRNKGNNENAEKNAKSSDPNINLYNNISFENSIFPNSNIISDQIQNISNNDEIKTQMLKNQLQKSNPIPINYTSPHQIESGQPLFISSTNNQIFWNYNQTQNQVSNINNNICGNSPNNFNNIQNSFFPIRDQKICNNQSNNFFSSYSLASSDENLYAFDNSQDFNNNEFPKENDESSPNKKNNILDFEVNIDDFDEFINSLFSVNEN